MFDFLRERGSAFITQVSNELMGNPAFLKAMETAYRGKERLDGAVAQALRTMNVPSRTEFKRAVARIDALERELAELRAKPAAAPARRPGKKKAAARGARRKAAPPAGA
jgi:hypothetical protein